MGIVERRPKKQRGTPFSSDIVRYHPIEVAALRIQYGFNGMNRVELLDLSNNLEHADGALLDRFDRSGQQTQSGLSHAWELRTARLALGFFLGFGWSASFGFVAGAWRTATALSANHNGFRRFGFRGFAATGTS